MAFATLHLQGGSKKQAVNSPVLAVSALLRVHRIWLPKVQIPLHGPDQTLSPTKSVGSARVTDNSTQLYSTQQRTTDAGV